MSKNEAKTEKKQEYPSPYGSHKSMINEALTQRLPDTAKHMVILTDEHGDYLTERNRLDGGLADFNRCTTSPASRKAAIDAIGLLPVPTVAPVIADANVASNVVTEVTTTATTTATST
jgi:hypothetical protein